MAADAPEYLDVGQHGSIRRIALRRRAGSGPTLVWLGGFRSDMRATKATAIDAAAQAGGFSCLRFDYGGHGESGGRFEDLSISTWLEDALAVIENFGGEKPVLVGSSMGGWIALLAAQEMARRGKAPGAMVLIAPAVDFTEN